MGLFDDIREVVRKIPKGKVSTYGDIAAMVGTTDARKAGWALHGNQDKTIPCHRVVKMTEHWQKTFRLVDGTNSKNYLKLMVLCLQRIIKWMLKSISGKYNLYIDVFWSTNKYRCC